MHDLLDELLYLFVEYLVAFRQLCQLGFDNPTPPLYGATDGRTDGQTDAQHLMVFWTQPYKVSNKMLFSLASVIFFLLTRDLVGTWVYTFFLGCITRYGLHEGPM